MARCIKGTPSSACIDFEIEYQLVTIEAAAEDTTDWSMIITIYIGFSIMFIAFLYFEWRSLFMCCKRCQEKICGQRTSTQPIYVVEESQDGGGGFQFEEGEDGYNDSQVDDNNQSDSKIVRLINGKSDGSYDQPSMGFDESNSYTRKDKDD